jgi:hypothetical protein
MNAGAKTMAKVVKLVYWRRQHKQLSGDAGLELVEQQCERLIVMGNLLAELMADSIALMNWMRGDDDSGHAG